MLINRKLLLLLITIVFLVGIQTTFATDINDTYTPDTTATTTTSQIQDIQTNTITHTQENIQTTTNDKLDTNDKQSDTNTITKTSKNSKTDGEKITKFRYADDEIYYQNGYISIYPYVEDENGEEIHDGKVIVKIDGEIYNIFTNNLGLSYYAPDVEYFSIGEHIVTLNYTDSSGNHPSNETSYKITILDLLKTTIETSYNPILPSNQVVELQYDVHEDTVWDDRNFPVEIGTVSVYYRENNDIINTASVLDKKIELNLSSILSNYEHITNTVIPVTVMYNDTTGKYENYSFDYNLYFHEISNNTLIVEDAQASIGETLRIPFTVKNNEGIDINPKEYSILFKQVNDTQSYYADQNPITFYLYDEYESGIYEYEYFIYFDDNTVASATSTITINPKSKETKISHNNLTVYSDDKYAYINLLPVDEYEQQITIGQIAIYLDDEYLTTVDRNQTSYYELNLENIEIGEHDVILSYTDETQQYPDNMTSFKLMKINQLHTFINYVEYTTVLSTDEYAEVTFKVYYNEDWEYTIDEGTVTWVVDLDYNGYVPIKTVDVNEGKIRVNLTDIISTTNMTINYPLDVHSKLIYNDSTGQYSNASYVYDFSILDVSNSYYLNVSNSKGAITETLDIPLNLLDKNNVKQNSKIEYVNLECLETNNYISYVYNDGIVSLSTDSFDEEGIYTLKWIVKLDDASFVTNTSTIILDPRPKTSKLPTYEDRELYKNQNEWYTRVTVSDEYDNTIYYGTVSVLLDGVVVDTDSIDGSYDVYCSIDLSNVSVGEHNVTITYTDDVNGEHPDNSTSFTLTKLDMLQTDINAYINNTRVLVSDENVEVDFNVYADGESVNVGNVTFFLDFAGNYIPIKTVNVTDGKIVVDLDSILSNYDNLSYPLYVDAGLMYNDSTGQFSESIRLTGFDVFDKMPVTLVILNNETKTDEETIITIKVTDYNGNYVPNGQLNMTGYIYGDDIDSIPFNATSEVTNGKATFTITNPNFKEYVGNHYQIEVLYADNNNVYADDQFSYGDTIKNYLILEINDTIILRGRYNNIPYVIKNKDGEILNLGLNDNSLTYETGGFTSDIFPDENILQLYPYYSTELGEYDITLSLSLYDYNEAISTFKVTVKDGIDVHSEFVGYDYDSTSTTFNFTIKDDDYKNVPKGNLSVALDLYDDGEIDYQGVVDVVDGQAVYKIDDLKINEYLGSSFRIYYNYTDVEKDYVGYDQDYLITVKDIIYLTVENQTGIYATGIYTPFTLKDRNGEDIDVQGAFTIRTDKGNYVYTCDYSEVYDGKIYIPTDSIPTDELHSGEIFLTVQFNSYDGNIQSNPYPIKISLYENATINIENEFDNHIYNKTSDTLDSFIGAVRHHSNTWGELIAYLYDEDKAVEVEWIEFAPMYGIYEFNIDGLKDQLKDLTPGYYPLNLKYVSGTPYVNSSVFTTQIIVTGTSTISTDKTKYSYYPSVDDNLELTIYDESNNNGTVVIYLVDNDKEIPIMAYYNMQSENISLNSIAKQLESKYGYTQGDSANLKLVYNSDFKYLDISQTEFAINFVEEKLSITSEVLNDTVGCVEVKVTVTDDYTNKPVSNVEVTIKLDDDRTVSAVTDGNGQVTLTPDVTFADQTYDIIAVYNDKQYNQTEEITIKQRPTEIIYTINNNNEGNVDIEISVVDKATGQKVPNADIKVTIPEQPEQTLTTDENGVKTINPELTPGTYEIPVEYPETINYTQSQNTITITVQEEDNRIKELEEQLRQANDNITQLTQEVKDLNDTKNNLTNQLAQANDKIAQQNDTINNLNNNITQLKQQLANATKNITDLKDKLAASQANATQLKSQLDSVNASLKDAQQQIAQQEKTIDNLEKQLAQANNNITQLKSQINDLNNTKTNLEKQLAQANNNITDLKDKLAASQANATQLDSQLKALNQTKNNLEKELNETNKNLTTAKEQINTLNNKVNDLNKQLTNAKNNVTALNNTLKDLNNTINNQNKTIADQNKTINNQNKTINDLNKTINNQTKTIDNLTKQIENLTAIKNITLTVSATNASVGSTVTFTATLKDSTGVNVNNGLVSFKVNGVTLKDEQGNTIFAKVSNGKASIKYTAQKTWYNKNLTVMAAYSGHGYNECRNTTNNFVVTAGKVNLKIADQKSHENGENTQFVVTVTDDNGNPIKSGQVLIKINGVTLKDANGKTITAKVANGLAIFDYKIALSARVHDITAVYSEKGYQRTEAKNTLNVTKGEAFIRVDPIKTSSDTTQVTANIVNQFKVNVDSQVAVAFKLNGRTAARTTAVNGVINATLDTKFTPGTYLLEIIIGETGMYKSDRVTTTIIRS